MCAVCSLLSFSLLYEVVEFWAISTTLFTVFAAEGNIELTFVQKDSHLTLLEILGARYIEVRGEDVLLVLVFEVEALTTFDLGAGRSASMALEEADLGPRLRASDEHVAHLAVFVNINRESLVENLDWGVCGSQVHH